MAKKPIELHIISKDRFGSEIVELEDGTVLKRGSRVHKTEFLAMQMVVKYTSVPIPTPICWDAEPRYELKGGQIIMTKVPGDCLRDVWDDLNADEKHSICKQVWGFVEEFKSIHKPLHLQHLYQCAVDGKLGGDVFITKHVTELQNKDSDITSDIALRKRISENYVEDSAGNNKYTKEELFDMLPRCDKPSVFTHGDLRPKNIMVSGSQVTAIINWETAGWYPEYWEHITFWYEHASVDWMECMEACAPPSFTWDCNRDFEGFFVASSVLI